MHAYRRRVCPSCGASRRATGISGQGQFVPDLSVHCMVVLTAQDGLEGPKKLRIIIIKKTKKYSANGTNHMLVRHSVGQRVRCPGGTYLVESIAVKVKKSSLVSTLY